MLLYIIQFEIINKPRKSKIPFKESIAFSNVCFKYEAQNNMPSIFYETNF